MLLFLASGCGGKAETPAESEPGDGGVGQDAQADVQGLDATSGKDAWISEADCGPGLCIDCVCQCPNGKFIPYGGCFDGCEQIPEVLKSCSLDCSTVCGPVEQNCVYGGQCAAGHECVVPPCEGCPEPLGVCVPLPCKPDGCWSSAECGEGSFCNGANPSNLIMGQCLPTPFAGQCWLDSDCPDSSTCWGASSCPVCEPCNSATMPGVCKAAPGQEAVVLWLDKELWYSSQPIQPTWFNFTVNPIYLPGCTTYDVEVLDAGAWKNLGPTLDCGWEGVAIKVAAGDAQETHASLIDLGSSYWNYPRYRFRGYWYEGCLDGLPISEAKCTASHEVLSREFLVEWPPD